MKILAIETSCDETAVAVLEATPETLRPLANIISSQVALHAPYGGVVPALASREHVNNLGHVYATALRTANISDAPRDISCIAVTRGPGLGPALITGITFAKALAAHYALPLVGVNHMDGHIHSNWLETDLLDKDVFPALNLLVSGGHTELVLMRDHGEYEIIGETVDDAVGEAFDKVARLLGLGYPGGPAISAVARTGDPHAYELPLPMAHSGDFNFSYAGLKTAVRYLIRDLGDDLSGQQKANVAASFQHAAVDILVEKTAAAAKMHGVRTVLLAGGVSANALLRERLGDRVRELGIEYVQPVMRYTTDNAAMIAAAAYFIYARGDHDTHDWKSLNMDANLRL